MKKIVFLAIIFFVLAIISCEPVETEFRVIYHANARDTTGYPPIDSNIYKTGDTATVLGKNTLQRDGYNFSGWNRRANGTDKDTNAYTEGDTITIGHQTIFLYAIWGPAP